MSKHKDCVSRAEHEAEADRLNHEIMAHQVGDGYAKGHERGSQAAVKFRDDRDAALAEVARLSEQNDGLYQATLMQSAEATRLREALEDVRHELARQTFRSLAAATEVLDAALAEGSDVLPTAGGTMPDDTWPADFADPTASSRMSSSGTGVAEDVPIDDGCPLGGGHSCRCGYADDVCPWRPVLPTGGAE